METIDDKQYFKPGDTVTLRLEIPNKPTMIVIRKETSYYPREIQPSLRGIRCRWFTTEGVLLEATWNTKDLILL